MRKFSVQTLFTGIVLLFGMGIVASAATITTQAECFDGATHNENFDPNSCSVGTTHGTAAATFTLPTSASDFTVATLNTFASPGGNGSVLTVASITADLDTAGPLRAGYIQVVASVPDTYISADSAAGTTQFSIGSYSLTCNWSIGANPPCTSGSHGNVMIPFTLGQPFSIDLSQNVGADSFYGGLGGGTSTVEFRFFEADGFTPVADAEVVAAPEPATWGFIALAGALALLRWTRKRQSARRAPVT